jgi:hypothetical protein
VPAYADGGDVEPTSTRARPTGRLTTPQDDSVSAAEFEKMKRDLGLDEGESRGRPSRLTERTAHTTEDELAAPETPASVTRRSAAKPTGPVQSPEPELLPPVEPTDEAESSGDEPVTPAPDEPENEGVADVKTGPTAPRRNRPRNRRHGRRR